MAIRRAVLTAMTTAALLGVGAAPALAATHFAAPSGSAGNWPCSAAATPCDLKTAIQGTGAQLPSSGDEVIVGAGTYTLTNTTITAPVAENIHGAFGQGAAIINVSGLPSHATFLTVGGFAAPSELADLQINDAGDAGLYAVVEAQFTTTLDRDSLSTTGAGSRTLRLDTGTGGENDTLRDTVAVATGNGGVAVDTSGNPGTTITVRNLTADATGTNGIALEAGATSCNPGALSVSLLNVIALAGGSGGTTLLTASGCVATTDGQTSLSVDYSDVNPAAESVDPGTSITPGTHNINQLPIFNSSAADPFSEKPNSPTVDKGTSDPANGTFDVDGRQRFLGAAPDIGAAELPAPYAVTGSATDVTTTSATLNGSVDSEGSNLTTTYHFEYGTTTAYGKTAPVPDGTEPGQVIFPVFNTVSTTLTNLQPGTIYDFALVAANSDGTTVSANHTFTTPPITHKLTIAFAGTGRGIVNASPHGGGCDVTCTSSLQAGTYTLTPTADSGSVFTGWSGGGCSGTAPCTLTLSADTTITATFTKIGPPTLTGVKLSGLRTHKAKLKFTVTQGTNAPKLKRLEVTLSNGYAFGKLHHAIHINDHLARARVRHGILIIKLPVAVPRLTVTLKAPAITVTNRKRHLKLTVRVKDAGGTTTILAHHQK